MQCFEATSCHRQSCNSVGNLYHGKPERRSLCLSKRCSLNVVVVALSGPDATRAVSQTQAHAGLIDFGQAKQLSDEQRLAFARLVLAMSAADGADLLDVVKAMTVPQQEAVSQGLEDIGIRWALPNLGWQAGQLL